MELAIPLIALGGLYVVSNQTKKEGFKSVNTYSKPNQTTDKYFKPDKTYMEKTDTSTFTDLAGRKVNLNDYSENMVPYFGKTKNIGNSLKDYTQSEQILDTHTGQGALQIAKSETAPLFKPEENIQWANGAPNQSNFYQSRVNPSVNMNNVKPFQEEMVGPGLGLGYGTDGSAGYNSGMLARDQWIDKNADQLRTANKPKATGLSLLGHEGPANSHIKQIATQEQMGIMEKNRPETSYAWDTRSGSDDIGRLMPGSALERGPTMRAIPIERTQSRPETAISYTGVAGGMNEASYIPGEYMPTHMQNLGALPFPVANANGRGYANDGDYGIKSKMAYPNNRTVGNSNDGYFGAVGGSMGAVIAPLLDILRPNRKSNVIGTLRPYQNPSTTVKNSYVFNPADRLSTTIRETTENGKGHLMINAQQTGGYQVAEQQVPFTNRNESGVYGYMGGSSASGGSRKMSSYEANYNQRNNDMKSSTIEGRLVPGNMSLMNGDINMRQVGRDDMLKNGRAVVGSMPGHIPDISSMGKPSGNSNQLYSTIQMDRNTPDITNMLKSNPYVVDYKSAL